MLVQIRDHAALSSLSMINLNSYLNSRDWIKEGSWGSRPAVIYTKEHGGRTWEVLAPTRDNVADYAERMADAVAVLAIVEDRSQLEVFYDIVSAGADMIRMNAANGKSYEPLSLLQSASMLKDAYDMVAAGARAAWKPQATYRGKMSQEVADYLEKVRPLPDYQEGYGLTLHSPIRAEFDRQQDMGDDFYSPFPRRATKKLAEALRYTEAAIEKTVADNTLDAFKEAVPHGVSANLCASVAALTKSGGGINIDLIWADVRPSGISDVHFPFSLGNAEILIEAAQFFRRNEPSLDERIEAQVVRLEREPKEFDGRATIVSTWDGQTKRMSVEFDKSVYDLVINAFRDHAYISLQGDIHPAGRGYELRNPRDLSVLSES